MEKQYIIMPYQDNWSYLCECDMCDECDNDPYYHEECPECDYKPNITFITEITSCVYTRAEYELFVALQNEMICFNNKHNYPYMKQILDLHTRDSFTELFREIWYNDRELYDEFLGDVIRPYLSPVTFDNGSDEPVFICKLVNTYVGLMNKEGWPNNPEKKLIEYSDIFCDYVINDVEHINAMSQQVQFCDQYY